MPCDYKPEQKDFDVILPGTNAPDGAFWYQNNCYTQYEASDSCFESSFDKTKWYLHLNPTTTLKDIEKEIAEYKNCEECGPLCKAGVANYCCDHTVQISKDLKLHNFCRGGNNIYPANCEYKIWDGKIKYNNNNWYSSVSQMHLGGIQVSSASIQFTIGGEGCKYQTDPYAGYYTLTINGSGLIWKGKKYEGNSPAGVYFREGGCWQATSVSVS